MSVDDDDGAWEQERSRECDDDDDSVVDVAPLVPAASARPTTDSPRRCVDLVPITRDGEREREKTERGVGASDDFGANVIADFAAGIDVDANPPISPSPSPPVPWLSLGRRRHRTSKE